MIEGFEDEYKNVISWNNKKAEAFYKDMTKEQYAENLKKILGILLNRDTEKDEIIE